MKIPDGSLCLRDASEFHPAPFEGHVDDRCCVERYDLGEEQATHQGNTERSAQFCSHAAGQGQWKAAKQRGEGGHRDGSKAGDTGLEDGLSRGDVSLSNGFDGEVYHENAVLFDDTHEQDDPDKGNHRQLVAREKECQ